MPKCPFGIFRKKNGKKTIAIFVISNLESAEMQKIAKKKKKNQIWDQNCLISVFWAVSLKKCCHISNQHLQIWKK